MLDVGRVCVKTAGREAGKLCVVVKKVDDTFVTVTGPRSLTKVKRRRCNVEHLSPLEHTVKIKADAPDADVEKAMKTGKILEKAQPSSAEGIVKKARESAPTKEQPAKKPEKKEEKPRAEKAKK